MLPHNFLLTTNRCNALTLAHLFHSSMIQYFRAMMRRGLGAGHTETCTKRFRLRIGSPHWASLIGCRCRTLNRTRYIGHCKKEFHICNPKMPQLLRIHRHLAKMQLASSHSPNCPGREHIEKRFISQIVRLFGLLAVYLLVSGPVMCLQLVGSSANSKNTAQWPFHTCTGIQQTGCPFPGDNGAIAAAIAYDGRPIGWDLGGARSNQNFLSVVQPLGGCTSLHHSSPCLPVCLSIYTIAGLSNI